MIKLMYIYKKSAEPKSCAFIESLCMLLQFRTSSNQLLTSFVASELSEVLNETASQIFCFFVPLCSVSISIARIQDIRINTRQFCRYNEIEVRDNLCRSFVDRTVQDSIDDTSCILDRDTFTSTCLLYTSPSPRDA